VVERDDRASIAGFYWEGSVGVGEEAHLDADTAHHAHVRRLRPGARVRLTDGRGQLLLGVAAAVSAKEFVVQISERVAVPAPIPLHVVAPVADRDRMLLAAEKCVELQATSWTPAFFARSRSVAQRGEGEKFREKTRARMISALEQSGGAWLPQVREETEFAMLLAAAAPPLRLLLEARGTPIGDLDVRGATTIAVGPEGGLEAAELEAAMSSGWRTVSLAASTLRFETALVAGVAVIRALQLSTRSG